MISTETQPEQALSPVQPRRTFLQSRKSKILLVFIVLFLIFAGFAGRLLISDHPEKSDVIVVLAGDSQDERYRRGMELLRAGYAKRLFLDASSDSSYFGHTPAEYADAFLKQDAKEMVAQVSACPF